MLRGFEPLWWIVRGRDWDSNGYLVKWVEKVFI